MHHLLQQQLVKRSLRYISSLTEKCLTNAQSMYNRSSFSRCRKKYDSGTPALSPERQSARMSEIKNSRLDLDGVEHF